MKNIVLVGFMGTGKSSVGRTLSSQLGIPFLDLDERIEKRTGQSIAEIFEKEGEPAFRRVERKAVQEASQAENQVIAPGGGVMMDPDNVAALKRSGLLICLTATPEVILQRTASVIRPLLRGNDPKKRIGDLLHLRRKAYAQADITIDTSERTIEQVVEEILLLLKKRKMISDGKA